MPGQRRLAFEVLADHRPVFGVRATVGVERKEQHLADNEDSVLLPTTTGVVFYIHVCNLNRCTNNRLEFLLGDGHTVVVGVGVMGQADQVR
jgi:hypothetical protein